MTERRALITSLVASSLTLAFTLIMLALSGCMSIEPDTSGLDELPAAQFDAYCSAFPSLPCGHVFMFEAVAENELGHVELCVLDRERDALLAAAVSLYGTSHPTSRHAGPCVYCCPDPKTTCGKGANAFNGCFCPSEE